MVPVTTRTKTDRPKMASAGVEAGAKILVEVELPAVDCAKPRAANNPAPASLGRCRNFKPRQLAILIRLRFNIVHLSEPFGIYFDSAGRGSFHIDKQPKRPSQSVVTLPRSVALLIPDKSPAVPVNDPASGLPLEK